MIELSQLTISVRGFMDILRDYRYLTDENERLREQLMKTSEKLLWYKARDNAKRSA